MSNALAIGATTATLRHLLERGLKGEAGITVTTLPPDVAKTFNGADETGRVNLFLYHTQPNAAWRNLDPPRQLRPGETGQPALALDLFYLLTVYEREAAPTSIIPHELLGHAMSTLHDHMLLSAGEIKNALTGSELEDQIERVRITPHPLSVEELSKLWVIFQTEYRISAAYQVSVVLIESMRGARAPLPVLTRGKDDRGVSAQGDLVPPYPRLVSIKLPALLRNATLGTLLTVQGDHLDGSGTVVEMTHPLLVTPVPLALQPGNTDRELTAKLPSVPAAVPAGVHTLTLRLTKNNEDFERTTNGLPFALAPEITNSAPGNPIGVVRTAHKVTITLDCQPEVRPGQRAALLLGDRTVAANPFAAATTHLTFVINTDTRPILAGKCFVRLRVDNVDSELVKYTGDPPKPSFNNDLQITIP